MSFKGQAFYEGTVASGAKHVASHFSPNSFYDVTSVRVFKAIYEMYRCKWIKVTVTSRYIPDKALFSSQVG